MNVNLNLIEQNVIQINSRITINGLCECRKHIVCGKDYVWNPFTCNCENGTYLASIMDKINYDGIIDKKHKF